MKTLFLYLLIALGVAGILYCRVNLGMSWGDMSTTLKNLLPRMMSVGIVLACFVGTLLYVNRRRDPD